MHGGYIIIHPTSLTFHSFTPEKVSKKVPNKCMNERVFCIPFDVFLTYIGRATTEGMKWRMVVLSDIR